MKQVINKCDAGSQPHFATIVDRFACYTRVQIKSETRPFDVPNMVLDFGARGAPGANANACIPILSNKSKTQGILAF